MKQASVFSLNTGAQLARMGCDAMHLKTTLMRAAEDNLAGARRAVRKNWRAFNDYVDDVSTVVKKKPLKAVAFASGIALGAGVVAGWLLKRR